MQATRSAALALCCLGCHVSGNAAPDAGAMRWPTPAASSLDASQASLRDAGTRDGHAESGAQPDAGKIIFVDAGPGQRALQLPPANANFDYQLGGAYPPPNGVRIVTRDRTEASAPGLYNICYVNGFQVQPGEESDWDADLILHDGQGQPVVDPDWKEELLDVSTPEKRSRIANKLGGFIAGCASAGFDAVEIDNLDSYSRSGGLLTAQEAVALMHLLSAAAHTHELAIAQKNTTELLGQRAEMGTDFAVAEECSRYGECGDYVSTYGEHVLMIEYRRSVFELGCQSYGATHSIVLRDLDLVPAGRSAYVFDDC